MPSVKIFLKETKNQQMCTTKVMPAVIMILIASDYRVLRKTWFCWILLILECYLLYLSLIWMKAFLFIRCKEMKGKSAFLSIMFEGTSILPFSIKIWSWKAINEPCVLQQIKNEEWNTEFYGNEIDNRTKWCYSFSTKQSA